MKFFYSFLVAGIVMASFLLQGCRIDDPMEPSPGGSNSKAPLLRKLTWSNGMVGLFEYNPDSTIKTLAYSLQTAGDQNQYSWVGGRMVEMASFASIYKNVYYYRADGKLDSIVNKYKQLQQPEGYRLAYEYAGNGRPETLRYYQNTIAGPILKTTTTYEYYENGDLFRATTVSGNSTITHTVESYSAVCHVFPWAYISGSLDEYYTIYNYPVLSRMDKLPAKITRRITTGSSQPVVDRIVTNTFEISDRRLNKMKSVSTYPSFPQYDNTIETVYWY